MSWSNRASEIGPTSSRSRRSCRIISCPAAKGISGSSDVPIATVEPSGTNRAMASAIDITFLATGLLPADGLEEGVVVALELRHRVAAELLEKRFRQREGDHCLSDDSGRRDHAHIAALVVRFDWFLGDQVHRRDRLDGNAQVDGLAVGHSARQAAGPIGEVAKPSTLVLDLVVEV